MGFTLRRLVGKTHPPSLGSGRRPLGPLKEQYQSESSSLGKGGMAGGHTSPVASARSSARRRCPRGRPLRTRRTVPCLETQTNRVSLSAKKPAGPKGTTDLPLAISASSYVGNAVATCQTKDQSVKEDPIATATVNYLIGRGQFSDIIERRRQRRRRGLVEP